MDFHMVSGLEVGGKPVVKIVGMSIVLRRFDVTCHVAKTNISTSTTRPAEPDEDDEAREIGHSQPERGRGQLPFLKRTLVRFGLHPSAFNFRSCRFVYGFCKSHGYYVDYVHGHLRRAN